MPDEQLQEQFNIDKSNRPENSWLELTDQKKTVEDVPVKPIEEIKIDDSIKPQNIPISESNQEPTAFKSGAISSLNISHEKIKKPNKILLLLKFAGIVIIVFVGIYLFMTFPAIWARFSYWWKASITKEKPNIQTIIPKAVDTDEVFLATVVHFAAPEKPKEDSENPNQVKKEPPTKKSLGLTNITNDQLYVPKLDIKAPVIWDSSPEGDGRAMINDLQKGVAHFKGTVLPNQEGGNVFISGHSSYYWWDSGKYKTIFVNLDKLEIGDEIAIGYDEKVYIYKVWEKIVVKPEETWVLDQNTKTPNLSLMTCVPVGTNLRRLIVRSELVTVAEDKEEISVSSEENSQPQLEKIDEESKIESQPLPLVLPNLDAINLLPWRW